MSAPERKHPHSPLDRPEPHIDPPASVWPALIARNPNRKISPRSVELRRSLRLPTDRPVIMSGHQAQIWHPGILAKWIATLEAAAALSAAPAWLLVDQDSGDPAELRFVRTDEQGRPVAGVCRLEPGRDDRLRARATGLQPPIRIRPDVCPELSQIADALRAHEHERDAAVQVHRALLDLISPISPPMPLVRATDLSATALFDDLLGHMRESPRACAEAYNAAAERHPGARVRELSTDSARGVELPLWTLSPEGDRARTFADDLASTPPDRLAPRALLMTAIVRLAACDLFIHGLGGGVYDAITEEWIRDWLGESLAPSVVVSATVYPDVAGGADLRAVREADRAAWRAHAARHNPGLLGDARAQQRKRSLVEAVGRAQRDGSDPGDAFRALHEFLGEHRREHASRLDALDEAAASAEEAARASRRAAGAALDRTLPFPLAAPDRLLALRDEIRAAFGRGG